MAGAAAAAAVSLAVSVLLWCPLADAKFFHQWPAGCSADGARWKAVPYAPKLVNRDNSPSCRLYCHSESFPFFRFDGSEGPTCYCLRTCSKAELEHAVVPAVSSHSRGHSHSTWDAVHVSAPEFLRQFHALEGRGIALLLRTISRVFAPHGK